MQQHPCVECSYMELVRSHIPRYHPVLHLLRCFTHTALSRTTLPHATLLIQVLQLSVLQCPCSCTLQRRSISPSACEDTRSRRRSSNWPRGMAIGRPQKLGGLPPASWRSWSQGCGFCTSCTGNSRTASEVRGSANCPHAQLQPCHASILSTERLHLCCHHLKQERLRHTLGCVTSQRKIGTKSCHTCDFLILIDEGDESSVEHLSVNSGHDLHQRKWWVQLATTDGMFQYAATCRWETPPRVPVRTHKSLMTFHKIEALALDIRPAENRWWAWKSTGPNLRVACNLLQHCILVTAGHPASVPRLLETSNSKTSPKDTLLLRMFSSSHCKYSVGASSAAFWFSQEPIFSRAACRNKMTTHPCHVSNMFLSPKQSMTAAQFLERCHP